MSQDACHPVDSCVSVRSPCPSCPITRALRKSVSTPIECNVERIPRERPGINPVCETRYSREREIKDPARRRKRNGASSDDESDVARGWWCLRANAIVCDFPVTFGRQFNCRGTFGLLVEFPVSRSSELLTTLSTATGTTRTRRFSRES